MWIVSKGVDSWHGIVACARKLVSDAPRRLEERPHFTSFAAKIYDSPGGDRKVSFSLFRADGREERPGMVSGLRAVDRRTIRRRRKINGQFALYFYTDHTLRLRRIDPSFVSADHFPRIGIYGAGNRRKSWLFQWLQKPTRRTKITIREHFFLSGNSDRC